jgi:hypothetical protein
LRATAILIRQRELSSAVIDNSNSILTVNDDFSVKNMVNNINRQVGVFTLLL